MSDELWVFDLGQVLLDVDFERFVTSVSALQPDADADALRAVAHSESKAQHDRGRLGSEAFLDQIAAEAGLLIGRDQLRDAWVDIFTPRPAAAEAIAALGDVELWMLSDTDPLHFARVLDLDPLARRFDRYLLSYARGRLKAEPGGMAPLAAEARRRPVRFFDDRADNVAAAAAAGVQASLFTTWPAWWAEHGPA